MADVIPNQTTPDVVDGALQGTENTPEEVAVTNASSLLSGFAMIGGLAVALSPKNTRQRLQKSLSDGIVGGTMQSDSVKQLFSVSKKDEKDAEKVATVTKRQKALQELNQKLVEQFGDRLFDPGAQAAVKFYTASLLDPTLHPRDAAQLSALSSSDFIETNPDGTTRNMVIQAISESQRATATKLQKNYEANNSRIKNLDEVRLGETVDLSTRRFVENLAANKQHADTTDPKKKIWVEQKLLNDLLLACCAHNEAVSTETLEKGLTARYIQARSGRNRKKYELTAAEKRFLRQYSINYFAYTARRNNEAIRINAYEQRQRATAQSANAIGASVAEKVAQNRVKITEKVNRQKSGLAALNTQPETPSYSYGTETLGQAALRSTSDGISNIFSFLMDLLGRMYTGENPSSPMVQQPMLRNVSPPQAAPAAPVARGGGRSVVSTLNSARNTVAAARNTAVFLSTPVGQAVVIGIIAIGVIILVVVLMGNLPAVAQPEAVLQKQEQAAAQQQFNSSTSPSPNPSPTSFTIPIGPPVQQIPTTLQAVITNAAQAACIPSEMLTAISKHEAGGTWSMTSEQFNFYNTPGWWTTGITKAQACRGYDYNTCTNGILIDTTGLQGQYCGSGQIALPCHPGAIVSGPMQFEIGTWGSFKAKVEAVTKRTSDQRVISDAFMGAAFKIKADSRNTTAGSCSNWTSSTWSLTDFQKAAQGYMGGVGHPCIDVSTGKTHNVCGEFCDLYNQYVSDAKGANSPQILQCEYFWTTYGRP